MDTPFRVVLIDDDADLRKLLKMTLEFTAGWLVNTAAEGASGIDMVREIKPDIAVVDVMMPDMDGYEVCHRLKADPETADVPVVLISARKALDEERVRDACVEGVLIKPFDPDQLADQLRGFVSGGGD